ncbi:MAG: four-carbon acid sugar kinase family protein [Lachnospiraceae bacterium]|nr:four-carbon acid sugar kinase family protein [Lachnospiraceae bacterium]
MKLLLIADDFTGALDTGVQFVNAGARAEVFLTDKVDFAAYPDTEVFIVDTETRHLRPEAAYGAVFNLVKRAMGAGVETFYKKTDSGLRGNVGAEIEALSDALGRPVVFAPAYPAMGRTVKDGVSYVDGVPVNESVFGRDPFDPVRVSRVRDLFRPQFDGVRILDAETDEELDKIAEKLVNNEAGKAVAGCAGLASFYVKYCKFEQRAETEIMLNPPVLAVCGSISSVSKAQVEDAAARGFYTAPLGEAEESAVKALREKKACILENFTESGRLQEKAADGGKEAMARMREEILARFAERTASLV